MACRAREADPDPRTQAVLKQWQIELREKLNLNWPIYDEGKLVRYPARALRGNHERKVDANLERDPGRPKSWV